MKVFITGGSSGIGFLTGIVLASRGHSVYMSVKTFEEKEVLEKKLIYLGLDVVVLKLDLLNDSDIENISDYLSICDTLFLHAGVGYIGLIKDIDISLVNEVFLVNVIGNLKLIQKFYSNNKKIVMTSSLIAGKSIPYFGIYSMSKKCIDIMINNLRKEGIFSNNKFVLIRPGAYHTGFNQYMILSGEKSNISSYVLYFINKIFLFLEEKSINNLVVKIVCAIEKDSCRVIEVPFYQSLFSKIF